jgi:hypothetical protein
MAGTAATKEPAPLPGDDVVYELAAELEETVTLGSESEQEIFIDADSSIDLGEEAAEPGWSMSGDFRALVDADRVEARDGTASRNSDVLVRASLGGTRAFSDSLRVRLRLAAACTSASCVPDSLLDEDTIGSTDRTVDVDEAFLHWFRSERFDLAVGRFQARFITRGGVFAKSLDRNDSTNARITWTDGLHGTLKHRNGWESHLIVQYNPEDGPAQVLREPLDFTSGDSRASLFVSLQNDEPVRFLTQRALDVSYYPSALLKDGTTSDSRLEDYWGVVARMAGRWPKRSTGRRLRFSGEVGFAPETPTEAAVGIATDEDTSGFAGAMTLSIMDLWPRHHVGLNLAHAEAGWLLSPQYNKNERLAELRWVWAATDKLTVDARVRHRQEIHQRTDAERRRRETDAFLRLTWRFRADWPTLIH